MTTVRDLHSQAMELAQLAMIARHMGDLERSVDIAKQAYELEREAAEAIPPFLESEPTRSILYRSAASLAYQARLYLEAQRLIFQGLVGYPPPQIEQELGNLFDQVRYARQLQDRNVIIDSYTMELVLRGQSVGEGVIPYHELTKRLDRTKSLIDKTSQRLSLRNYQRSGRQYQPFVPIIEALKAGSFIVTLRLEVAEGQNLPLLFDATKVIDEVITGIGYINDGNEAALRNLIDSESYYNHFLSMTQDMAPDGKRINLVAFNSLNRNASLTRKRNDIEIVSVLEQEADDTELEPIRVEGVLDYASSRKKKEESMGLTTRDDIEYTVVVREGMEEYIRAYYKQYIVVTGVVNNASKTIYLSSLEPVEDIVT